MTGLPRKLIYGKRRKKIINVAILPLRTAQFSGLRRAGEVEFVIIAREGGWSVVVWGGGAITKGPSSPECYTEGKSSGHEAAIMILTLPGILLSRFITKLQMRRAAISDHTLDR